MKTVAENKEEMRQIVLEAAKNGEAWAIKLLKMKKAEELAKTN